MTEGSRTRVRRAIAASLAAASIMLAAHGSPALAAPPELQVVTDTTYEVRPAERVIHVVVDGRATSYKPDSADRIYYFITVRLVLLGGASQFAASAAGAPASVSVIDASETQVVVDVALNRQVRYRQTGSFHLEFDLTNDAAAGDVRIGANVGAFPVWAVGSQETPGSSVTISVPPDFQLDVQGEDLPDAAPRADGGHIYRWPSIPDPTRFGLYATADLATITDSTYRTYTSTADAASQEVEIIVKAWADDPGWGERTSSRITAGIPILADLIGVRYFGTRQLIVVETVSRSIDGYAGIFDNSLASDEIQVAFDAGDAVILHEAAHAWFNGSLASDRWILEGFAEYYGVKAAEQLGIEPNAFELTDDLRAIAFPLAEWENPGLEEEGAELYGYAASFEVARLLVERAGDAGVTDVFRAMAEDEAAYQPLHADVPEASYSHPTNWHYFLDLLEERTHREYADILVEWVVPSSQLSLLADRDRARDAYSGLRRLLGDWDVPDSLRRQMNAWAFGSAIEAIGTAHAVLADRTELNVRGNRVGVHISFDEVRSAFERGSYDRATATQRRIDGALGAYQNAHSASAGPVDALESIGLLFADPVTDLANAAAALETGDWQLAAEEAHAVEAAYRDAAGLGALRLAGGAAVLVIVGSGGVGLRTMARLRGQRGRLARLAGDAGDVAEALDPAEHL